MYIQWGSRIPISWDLSVKAFKIFGRRGAPGTGGGGAQWGYTMKAYVENFYEEL